MSKAADASGIPVDAPTVRLPRQGLPGVAIAGIGIAGAVLLFVGLDARRQNRTAQRPTATARGAFVPPPPLALPPATALAAPVLEQSGRTPPPVIVYRDQPVIAAPPLPIYLPSQQLPPTIIPVAPSSQPLPGPTSDRVARALPSPFVIDTEPGAGVPAGVTGRSVPSSAIGPGSSETGGDSAAARATAIANRSDTVPIGTMIPIVLETPIDTARPGLVRAVVSVDTRGFDGRRVLIPRGSRLIGEYQADVRPGQNRVLVNWTRLVRPDGVTIQLSSPAADALGGAGVPGRVHSFFLQRFAGALLQSALTVGVNLASRPRAGSVVVGLPSGPITTVGQWLVPTNELRPKITVKQGAVLNVFVARDLDFSASGADGGR